MDPSSFHQPGLEPACDLMSYFAHLGIPLALSSCPGLSLWVTGSLTFSLVLSPGLMHQPRIHVLVEVEQGCFQITAIPSFYYIPFGRPSSMLARKVQK